MWKQIHLCFAALRSGENNMEFNEEYDLLTSSDKDTFARACRRLLKQTFVVRDKNEDSRKLYFFIKKNKNMMKSYLEYMGFDLVVNQDTGVAMLANGSCESTEGRISVNRLQLKKIESIILCCFWTLYIDRMKSGTLMKNVNVSVAQLRFELEKYGLRDKVDKTALDNAFKVFSAYQLIEVNGNLGDEDCMIRLLPSMEFCLDTESFRRFAAAAANRMMDTGGDIEEDEE